MKDSAAGIALRQGSCGRCGTAVRQRPPTLPRHSSAHGWPGRWRSPFHPASHDGDKMRPDSANSSPDCRLPEWPPGVLARLPASCFLSLPGMQVPNGLQIDSGWQCAWPEHAPCLFLPREKKGLPNKIQRDQTALLDWNYRVAQPARIHCELSWQDLWRRTNWNVRLSPRTLDPATCGNCC